MAIAANKKQKSAPARRRPAQGTAKSGARKAGAARTATAAERSAPPLAEVDAEVLEFIEAIDRFKREHGRPFPSWSEVLMVLRELGYRRPGA